MTKTDNVNNIFGKIKRALVLILIAFIAGLAIGYYFGYDIGFEKAVRILAK